MYHLLETLRVCAVLLTPFIPDSSAEILRQIGACADCSTWESAGQFGSLRRDVTVVRGDNLFPRIDAEKELEALEQAAQEARKAALPALEVEPQLTEKVDFDTFCKSDFRAVKVKDCQAVKKSNKLLRFTLDDGTGTDRQILSGIAAWYQPEELVGKTLVAIVNLPPEDDGPGELRNADFCRPHGEGRGKAEPADDRRSDPRRGQAVLMQPLAEFHI